MELRNAISARFGTDLPATAIFDYPTITALADYLIASSAAARAADMNSAADRYQEADAQNDEEVAGKLAELLREIVGSPVGLDEPFMEVCSDALLELSSIC